MSAYKCPNPIAVLTLCPNPITKMPAGWAAFPETAPAEVRAAHPQSHHTEPGLTAAEEPSSPEFDSFAYWRSPVHSLLTDQLAEGDETQQQEGPQGAPEVPS